MIVLADYNLNRQALLLSGSLAVGGWLDLVPIRLVTFEDLGLSADSNDRVIWRFAQANRMLLITANRNAKGENSLEQVMREENVLTSFPIITIGDPDRGQRIQLSRALCREACRNCNRYSRLYGIWSVVHPMRCLHAANKPNVRVRNMVAILSHLDLIQIFL